ncbi:protein ANTAGONIST OF LIKE HETEROCHROMATIN PROTEIN 1-like [Anoplophora glabripennis]|uniref:protein ANTAGONIST OF LIKE HETEROCHROMATIN PROTEIN 1-like n=1 Tax=Anoplophora glabripennis TaxID=217634 RepID=UPI00087387B7|nr:protein ANTAGONIST OF LIKE HETEROCHROMATIN PROTEIN 1-like [Anoplophora glabripennis]
MDKLAIEAFLYSADFGEDYHLLASSSSSESEEECCCSDDSDNDVEKLKLKRPRVEGFAEISVPLFDDSDFKNNFRVSKATCDTVTELIYDDFCSDHKGGWEKITPVKAAYVLLWYLGNKETFKQISERFKITQSCVHNIVKVGCRTLSSKLADFIEWPEKERYENESEVFHNTSKISGIIGAIGVSHIKILRPKEEPEKYNNKKNYHSIAVQGVVGSKRNFIDLYISEGSLEAYQILERSSIPSKGDEVMDGYFLVGGTSYPTYQWLVTPFSTSDQLNPEHEEFNRYLGRACRLVRDAFGKLKERFQRLNHFENKEIPFIVKCIEAACVIHNICLGKDDDCEFFDRDEGMFDCEFDFEGECAEKRVEVFDQFVGNCREGT